MKKIITVLVAIIVVVLLFALIGYFNHDQIDRYINNKAWLSREAFASIITDDISSFVANDYLVIANNDEINFYSAEGKLLDKKKISSSSVNLYGRGAYTVVEDVESKKLYCYKEKNLIWEKQLPPETQNIIVSKNGFVILCFAPNGYKSGVNVYNNQGDILVTSYLASTYAVDACLSSDNKLLYISEINLSGIEPQSYLKVIDISMKDNSKEIFSDKIINNTIITDIEYISPEYLLAMTTEGIYKIMGDYSVKQLCKFEDGTTMIANINKCKHPIVIDQDVSNEYVIKKFGEEIFKTTVPETIQTIDTMDNKIAVMLNNEVVVFDETLKEIGQISVSDNVTNIRFVKNTNTLAIIYKNKIEFVKL